VAEYVRTRAEGGQHSRHLREHLGVIRVGMQETEQFVQGFDLGGRAKLRSLEHPQQREPCLGTPRSVRASERGETGEQSGGCHRCQGYRIEEEWGQTRP